MDSAWLGGASHSVNDVSNIENGYIPSRVINNYYSITFRHCVSRHDVMKYLACHKTLLAQFASGRVQLWLFRCLLRYSTRFGNLRPVNY